MTLLGIVIQVAFCLIYDISLIIVAFQQGLDMYKIRAKLIQLSVIFEILIKQLKFHFYGVYFSTADPHKTGRLIESSALCYHCYTWRFYQDISCVD